MSCHNENDKQSAEIIIACEALRPEIDYLRKDLIDCPELIYMEQGLHNNPDKMRLELNKKIAEIESTYPQLEKIILCYGLCGRGMHGVTSSRARMVIPKVHDCVPLFVGLTQDELDIAGANSGILWLSAGMMEYGTLPKHLVENRHEIYKNKFGEKRAARMIAAENALYCNYKGVRYVRWPLMNESFAKLAEAMARELSLAYDEIYGKVEYLHDLLTGNHEDPKRFLIMEPGWTISMDTGGEIIAQKVSGDD